MTRVSAVAVNVVVGGGGGATATLIRLDFVMLSEPSLFETDSLTLYEPAVVYWKLGFWAVESTVPSFWKSHAQLVGVLVDWSVNCTVSGTSPDVGVALKAATGGAGGGG
jgi:hypothetical protein